jgi:hypothetical protein
LTLGEKGALVFVMFQVIKSILSLVAVKRAESTFPRNPAIGDSVQAGAA